MKGTHEIRNLVQSNHADPSFCVKKLAVLAGISTSYLRECVHRNYRVSPHVLIETYRVQRAVQLLQSSHCPVEEVAMRAGFWSAKTFRRAFRRKFGCCPSHYRHGPDPEKACC